MSFYYHSEHGVSGQGEGDRCRPEEGRCYLVPVVRTARKVASRPRGKEAGAGLIFEVHENRRFPCNGLYEHFDLRRLAGRA